MNRELNKIKKAEIIPFIQWINNQYPIELQELFNEFKTNGGN